MLASRNWVNVGVPKHSSLPQERIIMTYDLLFVILLSLLSSLLSYIAMKVENKIRYKHKYNKRYMWQLGAFFWSNCLAQEHLFPHIYIYEPFLKRAAWHNFRDFFSALFRILQTTWGSSATHRSRLFCHVFGNATSKWTKAATCTSVGCECFWFTTLKTNISPEQWWLEDAFPTEIVHV